MTTALPNIEDWATLSEADRTLLARAENADRPDDEEKAKAQFSARYEACEAVIKPYIESLGQFKVVQTHKHAMSDSGAGWGHENLVSSIVHAVIERCWPMAAPVARYWIDQHKAGETMEIHGEMLRCWSCGEKASIWEMTGNVLKPLRYDRAKPLRDFSHIELGECPIDPTLPYSVEIDVPSGKMVVANRLSPLFKEIEDKYSEEKCVNYLWGRKNCTEEYARQGYVEMNIGNCACRMFRMDPEGSKFVMGDYECASGHEEVASVCTDFWGYGIADFDLAVKNGLAKMQEDRPHMDFNIVECKPGRYRFTHRYHLCREDGTDIYTYIELVGPCT